jgi:hypothetical protein
MIFLFKFFNYKKNKYIFFNKSIVINIYMLYKIKCSINICYILIGLYIVMNIYLIFLI